MFTLGPEVDILPPIPVHVLKPVHPTASPPPEPFRNQGEYDGLPRSASYTHLPGVQEARPTEGIKRTFSDNVLALSPDGSHKNRQSPYVPSKELLRSASRKGKTQVAVTKFTLSAEDLEGAKENDVNKPTVVEGTEKPKPSTARSVSNTFRSFARRSWRSSSSRSPSPSPKAARKLARSRNTSPDRKQPVSIVSKPVPAAQTTTSSRPPPQIHNLEDCKPDTSPEISPAPWQRPRLQDKLGRRPLSAIMHLNKSETELKLFKKPSLQSLRSKSSSDKLSNLPSMTVPPIPSSLSSDRLSSTSFDTNKKKDPLWSVFRSLEGDFQK